MERLKNGALKFYGVVLEILEMGIALFLVVLIAMNLFELFAHIEFNPSLTAAFKTLQTCLGLCMNLIICTEFIRMVYTHTMQSVLEALIFAIARGLIVGHLNGEQTLLYIAAILLLMVMRKFLLRDSDAGESLRERVHRLIEQTKGNAQRQNPKES